DRGDEQLVPRHHARRLDVELVRQPALLPGGEERRDRLLPGQREPRVGEHEDPARDQHGGHEAEHWADPSHAARHLGLSVRPVAGDLWRVALIGEARRPGGRYPSPSHFTTEELSRTRWRSR